MNQSVATVPVKIVHVGNSGSDRKVSKNRKIQGNKVASELMPCEDLFAEKMDNNNNTGVDNTNDIESVDIEEDDAAKDDIDSKEINGKSKDSDYNSDDYVSHVSVLSRDSGSLSYGK